MATWRIKVGEKSYPFDVQMVTVEALKHVKQWFGPELGRYNNFVSAFFDGDPDAALCAIWIARRAAGETDVPEPKQMNGDFTLNQWLDTEEEPEVEDADSANPTGATPAPISESTPTSDSSGQSTDGPSPLPSAGSSET
jgi:hypothetical protein